MYEYYKLMHPNGMGQPWSDIERMPEWERQAYIKIFDDQQDEANENNGGGKSSGSRPARFSRG